MTTASAVGHVLDNPVWWSLRGPHASFAITAGPAARYPSDMTPFISVEHKDVDASVCAELVSDDEEVFFLGVAPRFDGHWEVREEYAVQQYVVDGSPFSSAIGARLMQVRPEDFAKLEQLASVAYPYFFRPRTCFLGPYYAIELNETFVAMGGERMRVPGYREISSVCAHPSLAMRGLGVRVVDRLLRSIAEAGDQAFFHCVQGNDEVIEMVERAGGRVRSTIPMWRVCRPSRRRVPHAR